MIEFKTLELKDLPLIREYFARGKSRNCDYTVGGLFMWRDSYERRYAIVNDTLILSTVFNDTVYFYFPVGENLCDAFREIREYCRFNNIPLNFCTLDDSQFSLLKEHVSSFTAYAERKWYDYIYDAKDLRDLAGKKNAARRNHIHKFTRLYPGWSYDRLEQKDIPELIEFLDRFVFNTEKEGAGAYDELDACKEVLENYELYGMTGGVLRADGKTVGFTAGEIIGDTLFVHIEKADVSFDGAYQMLSSRYLLQMVDDSVRYVNREDDSGDPGLRKSKLSFHPTMLLKKTNVLIGE